MFDSFGYNIAFAEYYITIYEQNSKYRNIEFKHYLPKILSLLGVYPYIFRNWWLK